VERVFPVVAGIWWVSVEQQCVSGVAAVVALVGGLTGGGAGYGVLRRFAGDLIGGGAGRLKGAAFRLNV